MTHVHVLVDPLCYWSIWLFGMRFHVSSIELQWQGCPDECKYATAIEVLPCRNEAIQRWNGIENRQRGPNPTGQNISCWDLIRSNWLSKSETSVCFFVEKRKMSTNRPIDDWIKCWCAPSQLGDDHFRANLMKLLPQFCVFQFDFDIRIGFDGSGGCQMAMCHHRCCRRIVMSRRRKLIRWSSATNRRQFYWLKFEKEKTESWTNEPVINILFSSQVTKTYRKVSVHLGIDFRQHGWPTVEVHLLESRTVMTF